MKQNRDFHYNSPRYRSYMHTIILPVFLERFCEFSDRLLGQLHPFQLHLCQPAVVLSNALAQMAELGRLLPHGDEMLANSDLPRSL